jgi:hypothetical protein
MSFLGFGFSPFGTSPLGFGAVPTPNSTTAKLLVKEDGTRGNAAYIDPATGDYVIDDAGQKRGADSVPMMVQLALLTVKDSSAVIGFGLEPFGGLFSTDVDRKVDASARAALSHMTKRKLISIQGVTFTRVNERAGMIEVKWINLASGEVQFTQVSL